MTHSLQILGLLDSFIKTDYRDPEVLIFKIKWSWFYSHPQGCTSFPTTSNLRWDLAFLKYNLNCSNWLNRNWQAEQSRAEYKPSTRPLATVDTRLRVRYLWVAWHLSQRDSPAYLGKGGGEVRLCGWLCLCFPFRWIFYGCAIQFRWQFEMTESPACRQEEFSYFFRREGVRRSRDWGWIWEMH